MSSTSATSPPLPHKLQGRKSSPLPRKPHLQNRKVESTKDADRKCMAYTLSINLIFKVLFFFFTNSRPQDASLCIQGVHATLKGSPNLADGALLKSAVHPLRLSAGPTDTTVIEKVTLSASMYQIPCSRGTIRETSEKRIKNSVPIIHDPERDRV